MARPARSSARVSAELRAPFRASPRRPTHALLTLLLLGLVGLVVGGTAGAAYAEDGYRYWNYSHLDGDTFAFADTGPGDYTPQDGAVEGWRFGTSTVSQGIEPRADLAAVSFDSVCADAAAAAGEKRVAVLIDYGVADDAADADGGGEVPGPIAECAVVAEDATGQQVLDEVSEVRTKDSMICALNGYPATGCGTPVPDATVAADEQPVEFSLAGDEATAPDDGPSSALLVAIVAAVIAVLGGGALLTTRRRRGDLQD